MHLIVELEGVVADVEPAYWFAYSRAVEAVQRARVDRTAFWRMVRRDLPSAHWIRDVNNKQLELFQTTFEATLESDECITQYEVNPNVAEIIGSLAAPFDSTLLTLGTNRSARQAYLQSAGLFERFGQMKALSQESARRVQQLKQLTDDRPTLLAASTPQLARSASIADFIVAGIARGSATPEKLRQAGAANIFESLDELASEIRTRGQKISQMGW